MSHKQSAFRSPWVIGILLLLLAVLAKNIYTIYMAQDNFPGLVVENAYERGKDLHENIRKRQAEKPDWNTQVDFSGAREFMGDLKIPAYNKDVRLDYYVTDPQGTPVEPQRVTFFAYRNSDARKDFSVEMTKVAAGHYQAQVSFPLKGLWDSIISATTGVSNIEHNTAQTIFAEE